MILVFAPIEAQPADIAHDGPDVLDVFLLGIGIVKSEMASAFVFFCKTEIQADRFDVTDVQIPVRFRWEPGYYGVVGNPAVCKVVLDDSLKKIEGSLLLSTFVHDRSFLMPFQRGSFGDSS